jgi:hypothetical protein
MRIKKVTGDRSWCYADDPVTNRQHGLGRGEKNSPQPKKLQFQKSPVRKALIIYPSLTFPIKV